MTEGLTTDLNMDLTTADLTTDSTTTDSLSAAVEVRLFSIYMLISPSKKSSLSPVNRLSREPSTLKDFVGGIFLGLIVIKLKRQIAEIWEGSPNSESSWPPLAQHG